MPAIPVMVTSIIIDPITAICVDTERGDAP